MDLFSYNKKRSRYALLSLVLTILIIASYVISIIVFSRYLLFVSLVGAVIVLVLLYLLSKFLIMKLYLNLKVDFIYNAIKKESKAKDIKLSTIKNDFIYHFYIKKDINIKSNFEFIYSDLSFYVSEFEMYLKRAFKSNKVNLAGKHIRFKSNRNLPNCVFILNYDNETQKFVDYYSYYFKKKNDNIYLRASKQYICLYEDKFDIKILEAFDKFNKFHMISIKDNVINILYHDTTAIFDFKLQNELTSNTVNACKDCFSKVNGLINYLRKEER